jgi:NAD(P)-dependent dehydrogenase (short-subunit alcohol dehydrogenase family)
MRKALVTGSTKGIGREVARLLVARGYEVTVHGRDTGMAETVMREVGAADAVGADLADLGDIEFLAGWAAEKGFDVLVNNAGQLPSRPVPIPQVPTAAYEPMMRLHLWAPLALANAVLPGMVVANDHGRIIWVSSEIALAPHPVVGPTSAPYVISKHAQLMASRLLQLEAAQVLPETGTVTSNVVIPGPTLTEGLREVGAAVMPDLTPEEAVAGYSPLARLTPPVEVASLIAYLAGPESAATRGAVLRADGGMTASVGG